MKFSTKLYEFRVNFNELLMNIYKCELVSIAIPKLDALNHWNSDGTIGKCELLNMVIPTLDEHNHWNSIGHIVNFELVNIVIPKLD